MNRTNSWLNICRKCQIGSKRLRDHLSQIVTIEEIITVIEIGDRQDLVLRPEMTTTVNIVLEGRAGVLAIPNGAVRRNGGGAYALVTDGTRAIRSPIETGFRGRSHTEVVHGLEEGAVVIVGDVEESDQ